VPTNKQADDQNIVLKHSKACQCD